MKKVGLFLLAVVMMAGVAGCGGGDDFTPSVNNMAGVYNLTKITVTQGGTTGIMVPPDISGTMNLTTVGTYTLDITIRGNRSVGSGPYAISENTIIFDGGYATGPITEDGRKFSFTAVVNGTSGTFEFTRV